MVATPLYPAYKGHMFRQTMTDMQVMKELTSEELASRISRCRVDTAIFDGIERLFWPVYEVSPGAKVVVLDWRPHKDWMKSNNAFTPALLQALFFLGYLQNAFHFLPWFALLYRPID